MLFFGHFVVLNGPQYNAEALSSASKHQKAVLCFTEKICVLDKLYSGMKYVALSPEFSVNESSNIY